MYDLNNIKDLDELQQMLYTYYMVITYPEASPTMRLVKESFAKLEARMKEAGFDTRMPDSEAVRSYYKRNNA